MPIVFIVSGVFVLLVCFDLIRLKSIFYKFYFLCLNLSFMLSFFVGDVYIFSFGINFLSLISVFLLLLFVLTTTTLNFFDLLWIVVVNMFYVIPLNSDLGLLISYTDMYVISLIAVCSFVYLRNPMKITQYVIITSVTIVLISGIVEINNFEFSFFDFNLVFKIFLFTLLFDFIICRLCGFDFIKLRRNIYDKKTFFNCNNVFVGI